MEIRVTWVNRPKTEKTQNKYKEKKSIKSVNAETKNKCIVPFLKNFNLKWSRFYKFCNDGNSHYFLSFNKNLFSLYYEYIDYVS